MLACVNPAIAPQADRTAAPANVLVESQGYSQSRGRVGFVDTDIVVVPALKSVSHPSFAQPQSQELDDSATHEVVMHSTLFM